MDPRTDSPAFFGTFERSRPEGPFADAPVDVAFAITATQPRLPPGRYTWQLSVDGRTDEQWAASFLRLAGDEPG